MNKDFFSKPNVKNIYDFSFHVNVNYDLIMQVFFIFCKESINKKFKSFHYT